jgi:hypothetical protein
MLFVICWFFLLSNAVLFPDLGLSSVRRDSRLGSLLVACMLAIPLRATPAQILTSTAQTGHSAAALRHLLQDK